MMYEVEPSGDVQDFVVETTDLDGNVDGVLTGFVLWDDLDGYGLAWYDHRVDEVHRAYVLRNGKALEAMVDVRGLLRYVDMTGADRTDVFFVLGSQELSHQYVVGGFHPNAPDTRMSDIIVIGSGDAARIGVANWLAAIGPLTAAQAGWHSRRCSDNSVSHDDPKEGDDA